MADTSCTNQGRHHRHGQSGELGWDSLNSEEKPDASVTGKTRECNGRINGKTGKTSSQTGFHKLVELLAGNQSPRAGRHGSVFLCATTIRLFGNGLEGRAVLLPVPVVAPPANLHSPSGAEPELIFKDHQRELCQTHESYRNQENAFPFLSRRDRRQ